MSSATVPSSLHPTDSAQNPYSMTPLPNPAPTKPPAIQSPTYGSSAYQSALKSSGMTFNDSTQQAAMATANPGMAQPVAGPSYTAAQIYAKPKTSAATAPKPVAPASPTSAAAMPKAPVAPPSPLAKTPVQEGKAPSGWTVNKQMGQAAPTGPPGSAGWPTREETGYFDGSGKWVKPTDLRYTGYYTDGTNMYHPNDLPPGTSGQLRWVDPWKNPYDVQ